jgi:phenylacetate-coenzyme A ligase PaaK-like adenylate-forming protein
LSPQLSAADQFRQKLLGRTLRSAYWRARLYRDKWSGYRPSRDASLEELGALPLVTKAEIARCESDWARARDVCAIQNTSGSTGVPLFIYRTRREFEFLSRFFEQVDDDAPSGSIPVGLHLSIPQHGTPTPLPARVFTLQTAAHNEKLLQYTLSLLQKRFNVSHLQSQVSLLSGDHSSILLLAMAVSQNPCVAKEIALKAVCLTGRQLTVRWREELSRVLSSTIVDRFTLSEVFGGATSCQVCGGFHFDPNVIAEIVADPARSSRPLESGVGYLVITSLAPFVSNQPFIRYLTGDLFRLSDQGCKDKSYFPLGRASQSLFLADVTDSDSPRTVLLPGRRLIDVLDSTMTLARPAAFQDVRSVRNTSLISFPYLRGEVRKSNFSTEVRIKLTSIDFADGTINPRSVPRHSPYWPLATLLLDTLPVGVIPIIELGPANSVSPVEKNTTLWADGSQKQ